MKQKYRDEICEYTVKKFGARGIMEPRTIRYVNKELISFIAVLAIIVAGASVSTYKEAEAEKLKCSSFPTQKMAQQLYDSNPRLYKALDKDHDGKACEVLIKK